MEAVINRVQEQKVIAIIRGVAPEHMEALFRALVAGGIQLAEITLNTDKALEGIYKMNEQFGRDMLIGAGTVLNKTMAREAIEAGARFLVSPNVDQGMIQEAITQEVLPIPGVLTPTEVVNAMNYGAKMVKLFPAVTQGPAYLKNILGPLDHVKVVAVGGISAENAKAYIEVGAVGIGVGGSLTNKELIEQGNFEEIEKYAKRLIQSVK